MLACLSCGSNEIVNYNSSVYCQNCGTVQEESQIVSDVTFGENSAGGAVVQGSYVSAAQSHVRSSNPRFRSGGTGESREQTMSRAREAIQRMGRATRVSSSTCEKALRWFNLALDGVPEVPLENGLAQPKNYILGRKQEYTIAACLYVACRYAKTSHLLIDFAEAIDINVFSLGRHYLKLISALNVKLPVIDPSFYILRFASLLDFGEETNKVAQDATRLCARFKKDWLGDGRRPAGICGAALLLAARMNNFQRSMNEIVQVVKMADVTIRERLEEFKRTPSGSLTVQDFKEIWLEEEHEPPAFYRPRLEEEKKKARAERRGSGPFGGQGRKKQKMQSVIQDREGSESDADDEDGGSPLTSDNRVGPSREKQELSKELDALVEEATRQEIDQYTQDDTFKQMVRQADADTFASQQRARLGTRAITRSQAELRATSTAAPDQSLNGQPAKVDSGELRLESEALPRATDINRGGLSDQQTSLVADGQSRLTIEQPRRRDGSSRSGKHIKEGSQPVSASAGGVIDTLSDLDEDELDQFILGEEEVRIKERVWMEFNHDYLQDALHRRLKEEADIKAGIYKKRPPRKRDGHRASLRDSTNARGATAEEATKEMLLRKKTSKKLNYGAIENLFNHKVVAEPLVPARRSRDTSRHPRKDAASNEDPGDEEIRKAMAAGLLYEGLDVEEVEGDVLPASHPLYGKRSKALKASELRKGRQGPSGVYRASSGDESDGHDVGAALTDGATTEGEGGEEAEVYPWKRSRQAHYSNEYGEDAYD